jgi:formate dehydrogenase gamma subunit
MVGNPHRLIWLAAMSLALGGSAAQVESIKDSTCLECHSDRTLAVTNATGRVRSLFVDEAIFRASAHRTNSCVSCHSDLKSTHPDDNVVAQPVSCGACHERQAVSYAGSVHGQGARDHLPGVASCTDCHGTHNISPPSSPASPLHFSHLTETCGACHEEAARDVEQSVHGRAIAGGARESATCTDCHSEHKIEPLKNAPALKISQDVCSKCHASERINTKFNLPTDRVKTFFDSYHGLAAQYGSTLAANCASCHGYHKILPSSDPQSTINKNHLVETCGRCHPGASENFAQGKVHVAASAAAPGGDAGQLINWWVRRVYLWMICGVVGAMLVHNLMHLSRRIRIRLATHVRPILRMDRRQRSQHLVLLTSFIVLAVTGFALRFPDSWLARLLGSSEPFRRWSHRIAGVVLLAAGAAHVVYLLTNREGRNLVRDFLPGLKDLKDVFANLRYFAGRSGRRPRFGRFGYAEKMEYWAVVWGTVIMGVTGLMIWCKMDVTRFLPRWAVEVATTVHFYEAILACLAIVVWHFYHVIFDPEVYPMNLAWWDGKVSEEWLAEEHPLQSPRSETASTPDVSKLNLEFDI